jgi:hypothetical protein
MAKRDIPALSGNTPRFFTGIDRLPPSLLFMTCMLLNIDHIEKHLHVKIVDRLLIRRVFFIYCNNVFVDKPFMIKSMNLDLSFIYIIAYSVLKKVQTKIKFA